MHRDLGIIVVGGGSARRFGGGNKLLVELAGKPLFLYCLERFLPEITPGRLVMVVPRAELDQFRSAAGPLASRVIWTPGGATRSESVMAGLAALPMASGLVAIHDAARPLADPVLLARLAERAREIGGAIPGKPVTDTLKRVNSEGVIVDTVEREGLFRVETPQVFDLEKLRSAYQRHPDSFTDDAGTMAAAGFPVALLHHAAENPKLTYADEVAVIARLLEARR